ncbi:MAG TPA: hypothetical protein VF306_17610, partial [Pirellulales bacterium]
WPTSFRILTFFFARFIAPQVGANRNEEVKMQNAKVKTAKYANRRRVGRAKRVPPSAAKYASRIFAEKVGLASSSHPTRQYAAVR